MPNWISARWIARLIVAGALTHLMALAWVAIPLEPRMPNERPSRIAPVLRDFDGQLQRIRASLASGPVGAFFARYVSATALWQKWDMYAPAPLTRLFHLRVRVLAEAPSGKSLPEDPGVSHLYTTYLDPRDPRRSRSTRETKYAFALVHGGSPQARQSFADYWDRRRIRTGAGGVGVAVIADEYRVEDEGARLGEIRFVGSRILATTMRDDAPIRSLQTVLEKP